MKKNLLTAALAFVFAAATAVSSFAFDEYNVWPDVAPGEKADAKKPTYEYWKPAEKTTDACLVVCPGGAYNGLAYGHEGDKIAKFFTSKGITVVVLKYRVPRRDSEAHGRLARRATHDPRRPQPRRRVGN